MISEQDKQAILNGAYGVTRSGTKVKLVFTSNLNTNGLMYLFVSYENERGKETYSNSAYWVTKDFTFFVDKESCGNDIVKLWEDKPEPFDLERALAGELIKYSDKPCYIYQSKVTGLFWVEAQDGSFVDNDTSFEAMSEQGMWKEPEPVSNTITLTLPCPLKEPKEGMAFFIACSGQLSIDISQYEENNPNSTYSNIILEEGGYFATKEDAQAWLDAMRNNRR